MTSCPEDPAFYRTSARVGSGSASQGRQSPSLARSSGAHRRWVLGPLGAFPDLEVPLEEVLAEGEKAATRYTMRGTHRGTLMGIPPTGRQVEITGMNVMRLSGDRLVEKRDEYDLLGILEQLGVLPPSTSDGD